MPDPDLVCEVRTEGGVYRDWLTVNIAQSFSDAVTRSFRLVCAEPDDDAHRHLQPGQRVDIALAGQVVIQGGYIKTRQAAYDANRHLVQVDGASKAGLTQAVSAQSGTGQFRGYKVDNIANAILKPLGLKFRVENGPDGWDIPFANVRIRHGESPFEMIARLATQRGLWIRSEADGTLVGGRRDDSNGVTFTEGVNILSANCKIDYLEADSLIFRSQQTGSDSLFGRKASEVSAKAPLSGQSSGLPRIGLCEMPASERELQVRTNMEAQIIEKSLLEVTLTYQGWLRPDGKLWSLTDFVTVKSPMLFPTKSRQMELKVWGYTYSQDAQAGTQTTLELCNKLAFGQRGRSLDAQQNDGFYQVPQQAQPEAAT